MVQRNAKDGYEEIIIGSGETFNASISDNESFTNKLLDVTASGAAYQILATGTDWTIRNIGVRGQFNTHTNGSWIRCYDPSGSSVIENLYFPGAETPGHDYDGPYGIYVHNNHGGDLLVKNVNIQNMQDNGIYASGPGNGSEHSEPGEGGTVRIEDSYFESNANANTRLGTEGSYCKNVVGWNGLHRGHWQYYERSRLIDCDYGGNNSHDIDIGGSSWDKQSTAALTVESTRYETTEVDGQGINGSSVGAPQQRIPKGVPTSAAEAATGGGSGGGGSTEYANHVTIQGTGQTCQYEIVFANGWKESPSEPLEEYDDVSGNTVTGYVTESSHVDGFYFDGGIESFRYLQGEATLKLNGSEVSASELDGFSGGTSDVYNDPTCIRDIV